MQAIDQQASELLNRPEPEGHDEPTQPLVKPIVVIKPAQIADKAVLETAQDVETYLAKLRTKLVAEVSQGKRVRLD
jgi:hypothetical protein